jgi:hypothetical protein
VSPETRTTETIKTHPALSRTGEVEATVIRLDFGMNDSKGRRIGGVIRVFEHVAFGGLHPRGAGFAAVWTVTRDGADFGVGNVTIFGGSPEVVEGAAKRKLAASKARYAGERRGR